MPACQSDQTAGSQSATASAPDLSLAQAGFSNTVLVPSSWR
jgi:hypothetical protein